MGRDSSDGDSQRDFPSLVLIPLEGFVSAAGTSPGGARYPVNCILQIIETFYDEDKMRRASIILMGMLGLPLAVTQPVQAADGKLSSAVQMYAGPSSEFPAVRRLAKGLSVDVHGCLKTQDWCDVSWRGNRGWIPAAAVSVDARAVANVPEVRFQLNTYWDAHYNSALWYVQRDQYLRQSASYTP